MSASPLPDVYHRLADEHDGAVAALLEELRERDGRRYRLTKRTPPSSLSDAARGVLQALLTIQGDGNLPRYFTYRQVKELGGRHEALRGRCWPEFRELLGADQIVRP